MFQLRKASERGHADHGWLDTWHTFSFASYYDPNHMGFRKLRVMNEDRVAPGGGFPLHGHRDMEILSFVLSGELEHKDSMGNQGVIRAGEVQRISAGSGIRHSEYNPSAKDPVHFYQIWLEPEQTGLSPRYDQKRFREPERARILLASPDGRDESISMHQDATITLQRVSAGETHTEQLASDRHAWIQLLKGSVTVGELTLSSGDGLAITGETSVALRANADAEVLILDLA